MLTSTNREFREIRPAVACDPIAWTCSMWILYAPFWMFALTISKPTVPDETLLREFGPPSSSRSFRSLGVTVKNIMGHFPLRRSYSQGSVVYHHIARELRYHNHTLGRSHLRRGFLLIQPTRVSRSSEAVPFRLVFV